MEREIERFRREAVAYYVFLEVNRQSAPVEVRRALTKRFGEAFSAPVLELTKVFKTRHEHALSDAIMKKWLEQQGHVCAESVGMATQLEEYLLEDARKQAANEVR